MDRELGLRFAEALNGMNGREYLKSMVAFAAAPTIKGKKPSSLMIFNAGGRNTMVLWRQHGAEICDIFRLEQFELKNEDTCIVVLLYRKKILEWYVSHRRNQPFLEKMGYEFSGGLEQKLQLLKRHFEALCPHEVGVFLGMPVEDVEGFIEHKGRNCLFCSYWKVYANRRRAELLFNAYDKARSSMAESVLSLREDECAELIREGVG